MEIRSWTGSRLLFCYVVALGLVACTREGENPSPFDIQKGSVQEPFDIAVNYFSWYPPIVKQDNVNAYAVEIENVGTDSLLRYKVEVYFNGELTNTMAGWPGSHPGPLSPGEAECIPESDYKGRNLTRAPKEPGRHSYRIVASLPSGYAETNLSNNELAGFFEVGGSSKPANLFSSKALVGCRRQ